MKLSVIDRLVLLNVLPKEGEITTLKVIRKLRDDLSFSEEEHKTLNFRQEGEALLWDEMPEKEIEIGERATDVIVNAFKNLSRQGKLHVDYVEMYDRFVKE